MTNNPKTTNKKSGHTLVCWFANHYGLTIEGFQGFGKSNYRDTPDYKWMRLYPSPHINDNAVSYKKTGEDMMSSYDMACRFRCYRIHSSSIDAFKKIPSQEIDAMRIMGLFETLEINGAS